MASSRLIAAITVRHGQVVKSYGYRRWRPAGGIRTALRNLDRWNTDEILVLDISRRDRPDPGVLRAIDSVGLSTPVLYGGGLRDARDVAALMSCGVDRVLVEHLAWAGGGSVTAIAEVVGDQAVVVGLPVIHDGDVNRRWDPIAGAACEPATESVRRAMEMPCAEVLVIDVDGDGHEGRFSLPMAQEILGSVDRDARRSLLWFGGIDEAIGSRLLADPRTTGVAVGNLTLERELAVPELRTRLRTRRLQSTLRRTGLRDA